LNARKIVIACEAKVMLVRQRAAAGSESWMLKTVGDAPRDAVTVRAPRTSPPTPTLLPPRARAELCRRH
jgi:hypothetical protein